MRRRPLAIALAAVLAGASFVGPSAATSAPRDDPRAEREQVRAEKAALAAQIDTDKATLAQVDEALQVLQENLDTQQAALDRAEAEVAQAEQEIADAEAAITAISGEIKGLKAEMRDRAVAAYVRPAGDDVLSVLGSQDFTTASARKFYVELRAMDDADLGDRLEGATKDLAHQKQVAQEARKVAESKRAEQAERTKAVEKAEAQQQQVVDAIQAHVDRQIDRSLELAKKDRALSAEIAQQQAELLARIAAQRESDRAAQEAARQAEATVDPDGDESGPSGGNAEPVSPEAGGTDAGIELAYIQGIPVNAKVADQVAAMINAAQADGVDLRIGNSYRSIARQIELRRQNCGSSYYAIYEMPSGSCHPPTAKPGQSQHQLGLAIDFANCSSRGTACYRWLAANASRFGYYNLPSEAWHWSTTGR